jgi:hypothetical protein
MSQLQLATHRTAVQTVSYHLGAHWFVWGGRGDEVTGCVVIRGTPHTGKVTCCLPHSPPRGGPTGSRTRSAPPYCGLRARPRSNRWRDARAAVLSNIRSRSQVVRGDSARACVPRVRRRGGLPRMATGLGSSVCAGVVVVVSRQQNLAVDGWACGRRFRCWLLPAGCFVVLVCVVFKRGRASATRTVRGVCPRRSCRRVAGGGGWLGMEGREGAADERENGGATVRGGGAAACRPPASKC